MLVFRNFKTVRLGQVRLEIRNPYFRTTKYSDSRLSARVVNYIKAKILLT